MTSLYEGCNFVIFIHFITLVTVTKQRCSNRRQHHCPGNCRPLQLLSFLLPDHIHLFLAGSSTTTESSTSSTPHLPKLLGEILQGALGQTGTGAGCLPITLTDVSSCREKKKAWPVRCEGDTYFVRASYADYLRFCKYKHSSHAKGARTAFAGADGIRIRMPNAPHELLANWTHTVGDWLDHQAWECEGETVIVNHTGDAGNVMEATCCESTARLLTSSFSCSGEPPHSFP